MLVSTHNSYLESLFHGATLVDFNNKPIPFVQEFNTETFQCTLRGGKVIIAASFVLPCATMEHLYKLLSQLPDALHLFICYEPDSEKIKERCQEFTSAQINRSLQLHALVEDWLAEKQKEETDG